MDKIRILAALLGLFLVTGCSSGLKRSHRSAMPTHPTPEPIEFAGGSLLSAALHASDAQPSELFACIDFEPARDVETDLLDADIDADIEIDTVADQFASSSLVSLARKAASDLPGEVTLPRHESRRVTAVESGVLATMALKLATSPVGPGLSVGDGWMMSSSGPPTGARAVPEPVMVSWAALTTAGAALLAPRRRV